MAAQQISYSDPTMNYLQGIAALGGTNRTSRGDPGAMDALAQILQQQMGQLTPEGLARMIQEIFLEGGKAVPGIATQFGQAVGARTSNNSGIAIANKQLQEDLMKKSASMIFQAQGQAAQTAAALGGLNRTESSSPSASMMQLLPFAPALLGKGGLNLGGLFENAKKFLDKDGADDGGVLGAQAGLGSSTASFGGTEQYATSTGLGGYDYGFDTGGVDLGGFDSGYGMGAGSDGIDLGGFDVGSSGVDFDYGSFDLGFADGGLVSKKKLGKATKKPNGYAEGGRITDVASRPIRGMTDNGQDQSLIPTLSAMTGVGNTGAFTPFNYGRRSPNDGGTASSDQNDGPGISVPSVVGTPDENAAAIAGMVGMTISAVTGIPSSVVGMALSALGVPNSSMSPVGKSINTIVNMISQALAPAADSSVTQSEDAVGGMSTVGPTGAGMSTTAAMSAPAIGLDAIASPVDGIAEGLGVGADAVGGGSSGGVDGVGDAAAAGVGGGGFKKGGAIKGKGTETSDSIDISVSDGEYVLNSEATEMFLPVIEMMNAIGLHQRNGGMNGTR